MTKLYPPLRYNIVQSQLHRGSYPKPRNFPFMAKLHLKTIISIVPDGITVELRDWMQEKGIVHIHVPCSKPKEGNVGLSIQTINGVINTMLDWTKYPLYIHCLDGGPVTGMIIMCLRRVLGWTEACILAEYSRLSKQEEMGEIEQEELDLFHKFGKMTGLPHLTKTLLGWTVDEQGELLPYTLMINSWKNLPPWLVTNWTELGWLKEDVMTQKHPSVAKIRYPETNVPQETTPVQVTPIQHKTLEDLIIESRTLSALALETGISSEGPFIVDLIK